MGRRVQILEFTGCTENEGDVTIVHAIGEAGGDTATLCGYPFVDEVKRFKETRKPVSCGPCKNQLECAGKYEKRHGVWF